MNERENGAGPGTGETRPLPEGVQVDEEEIVVKKVLSISIALEDGTTLRAVLDLDGAGELEAIRLGEAGPSGAVPEEAQVGPIPGDVWEKLRSTLDQLLEHGGTPPEPEPEKEPDAGMVEL